MKTYYERLALRLRRYRRLQGLTQAEVAKAIGVGVRTYSHYESGKDRTRSGGNLRLEQAMMLAVLYDVPLDKLAGRD